MPLAMSRQRLTSSDAMFLYLESRETMMHVAGLLQFTPPPEMPPDHLRRLVDDARAVIARLPHAPEYVRIDGVRRDDRLVLMEVEAIEPYLFLPFAPSPAEAMRRYVAAITR